MQGQSFTKIKGPNYGLNVLAPQLPAKQSDVARYVAQSKSKGKLKPKQVAFGNN